MNDVFTLQQRIAELEKQLKYEREVSIQKDAKIAYLYEQFRLAQQKQFGKSAEGFVGQGELFNELKRLLRKLSLSSKELATPATSLNASHCQKTYPVNKLSTT